MSPHLESASEFLTEWVAPLANAMDSDPVLLKEGLRHMERRGLLCLRRPTEFGGPEASEEEFRVFQEMIARYSGALAFLQTQHQSAVSLVAKSPNEELRRAVLPSMHRLEGGVGLGFSQLRRTGPPIMRAEPAADGYVLNGKVPWITGWTMFPRYVIAASLPNGEAVFGLLPLGAAEQEGGGRQEVSAPMALVAMQGAQTIEADLFDWQLKEEDVLFLRPAGWIERNDMINVTLQGWFALGCARAGLDVVEAAWEKRKSPFLQEAVEKLEEERLACREAMGRSEDPLEDRLKTRAWGIDLACRCAHAAVAASGGAANSTRHAAQRILRESLVFTVSAQTGPIMEATLARLASRRDA